MIRPQKRKPQPASQPRLLFELTTNIFYCNIQHFAANLTFKPSPNTAPATKSDTSPSPSTAPATKRDTSPSPSTAPATQSDTSTSRSTASGTTFTMRGATGVTIKPHQILRLPHKKTHILSPHHIWNLIYNARSNWCHHQTSPNTAPATKNNTAKFQRKDPKTGETSFPMRGRSDHDPTMIRPQKRKPQPASQPRLLFELTTNIFYCNMQHFAANLTFKPSPNTAPATKSDTSPSPSTAPATKRDTSPSPSTAPATQSDTSTSRSTASGTKSDTHGSSSSQIKPHLQCAEQQVSPSNLTKYCACHTKRLTFWVLITYETSFTMRGATGVTIKPHQILRLPKNNTAKFQRKSPKTGETSFPMRGRSDHDPTMIRPWSDHKNANRNPPRNRGYFSSSPRAFSIVKYNISRPILHSNLHQILHLPPKVTLELHQILRLTRKVTLDLHQV